MLNEDSIIVPPGAKAMQATDDPNSLTSQLLVKDYEKRIIEMAHKSKEDVSHGVNFGRIEWKPRTPSFEDIIPIVIPDDDRPYDPDHGYQNECTMTEGSQDVFWNSLEKSVKNNRRRSKWTSKLLYPLKYIFCAILSPFKKMYKKTLTKRAEKKFREKMTAAMGRGQFLDFIFDSTGHARPSYDPVYKVYLSGRGAGGAPVLGYAYNKAKDRKAREEKAILNIKQDELNDRVSSYSV